MNEGTEAMLTGRDTLDTATTSETTNGGLGYTLDVVTKNLAMTLGSAFAETFSAFATYKMVRLVYERQLFIMKMIYLVETAR